MLHFLLHVKFTNIIPWYHIGVAWQPLETGVQEKANTSHGIVLRTCHIMGDNGSLQIFLKLCRQDKGSTRNHSNLNKKHTNIPTEWFNHRHYLLSDLIKKAQQMTENETVDKKIQLCKSCDINSYKNLRLQSSPADHCPTLSRVELPSDVGLH